MITADKICFNYAGQPEILRDFSTAIDKKGFTALTGSNGSGKTTLGKLLAGILKPTSGTVSIFGQDSRSIRLSEVGRDICYCFQNPDNQLFAQTVEDEIGFALRLRHESKERTEEVVDEMTTLFRVSHLRKTMPLLLSGGEKRRVALAAGLALKPSFLILDEPTPGLDSDCVDTLKEVLSDLKARGTGALLISHDKAFVSDMTDRILVLSEGRIIDDRTVR